MSLKGSSRWACLQSLGDGYLHQDFVAEHGSAAGAVRAWLSDTSVGEARTLSSEWRTFLNLTHGMTRDERTQALRHVAGGSWSPADDQEFEAVSALLADAWRA